ncbi:hypothetical protein GETHLI_02090 [Geothrix limicola]|uniref:Outer membrane protein beta-barrel domain-containing protein n=1 Tax=Geothrix limicola TaxID=2927978 RepID=A0ABQ5QA57_9BACT|nr:hypothetical protein [Geothrix limicola]GLH71707.1 hypothetical protein GETHLI_02090 [Geothrix limicola]
MSHIKLGRLLLASAAILALPLAAKDGSLLNPEFKIRSGLTAGTLAKDTQNNQAFGFALANTFPLGGGRGISVELCYDFFPGNTRDRMQSPSTVYADVPGYGIVTKDPSTQNPLVISPINSTDSRAHKMEGFGVRTSYLSPIPGIEGLSWQAGLSLDAYKSSNEFLIDLRAVWFDANGNWHSMSRYFPRDANGNFVTAHEGYAGQSNRTVVGIGAHVGLAYQFSKEFKLEGNLRNIGYGIKDYTPLAYSGQPGTLSNKNGRGFVFEIGLSMKL